MRWVAALLFFFIFPPAYADSSITLNGMLSSPTIYDMDNDPVNGLEIVVASFVTSDRPTSLFQIYHNGTSMPGWPLRAIFEESYGGAFLGRPAIAELSGDQIYDIALATEETEGGSSPRGYVKVFYGEGQKGYSPWWWHHSLPSGGLVGDSSPVIGNFDSDTEMEILIGRDDGYLYWYNHNGKGDPPYQSYYYYKKRLQIGGSTDTVTTPAVGDIDGDGELEIAVCSSAGVCKICNKYGNSTMASMSYASGSKSSPALADLDSDGKLEVIVGSSDGKVYVWYHNGTTFPGWPVQAAPLMYPSPAVGDIDNDGELEIVIATDDNSVYALEADGTLKSGFPVQPQEVGTAPRSSPVLADVTGDDFLEIIFGIGKHEGPTDNFGKVYIWYHNGTLLGTPITAADWFTGTAAVADIDNDGNNEVVVGSWDGILYIWEGSGKSTVNPGWPNFHFNERNTRCCPEASSSPAPVVNQNPTASITSPSSGAIFQEGSTITFQGSATDPDGNVTSYNWTSNFDGTLSNRANFTTDGLSAGNHTITFIVYDDQGEQAKAQISLVVTAAGTSMPGAPGGGGGGGGGGGAKETGLLKIINRVLSGEVARTLFSDSDSPYITEISFKAKTTAYNVKVRLEPLEELPLTMTAPKKGKPFAYVRITRTGISQSLIEDTTISFKVPVTWMKEHDVNQRRVKLKKYKDGDWQELETSFKGEDSFYDYYTAKTQGFSYFAIVAEDGTGFEVASPEQELPVGHPPVTTPPPTEEPAEVLETPAPPLEGKTPVPSFQAPEPEKKGICGPGILLLIPLLAPAMRRFRSNKVVISNQQENQA